MTTYVQAQAAGYRWLLGHFVLPASRLGEFEALLPKFPEQQWSLSVIVSSNTAQDLEQLAAYQNDAVTIAALEFPVLSPAEIDRLGALIPTGIDAFFELRLTGNLAPYLDSLQRRKTFAKIRMGGITPDAFPDVAAVSRFMLACAQAKVPFKATAGLHHPLPGQHSLTYDNNSPSAAMHGFWNLAIAASLVYQQEIALDAVLSLLKESSPDSFQVQPEQIIWNRDSYHYTLATSELQEARNHFFLSFGSCSIHEPVHDLIHFHWL